MGFLKQAFKLAEAGWYRALEGMAWGGGHTRETDPRGKGWHFTKAWAVEPPLRPGEKGCPWLISRVGVPGCATLVEHPDDPRGAWDVGVYWQTPEEVIQLRCVGCDASYHKVPNVPGFGLAVIALIEAEVPAVIRSAKEGQP